MLSKLSTDKIYIILVSVLLAVSEFFKGLYDEQWQFVFMLFVSVLFGTFCITQKIALKPSCTMDFVAILVIGVYIICTFDAVSVWDSLMCVSRYLCCFMLYATVKSTVSGNHRLMYSVIYFISAFTSFIGLLRGIGVFAVSGAFDSKRGLLLSVFHYHNASAVFFACMFVLGMYLFRTSGNKTADIVIGISNSCLLSSIVYSQSRGTWLVMALAVVLYLVMDKRSEKFSKNILLILASGISVALVMNPFMSAFQSRDMKAVSTEIPMCLAMIAVSFAISGLISAFAENKKVNKLFSGKNLAIAIPVVFIVGAVAVFFLLPESIIQRISEFSLSSSTVSERTIFFRDALRIFKQHPINGIGGDSWKYVYPSVQTNFYTVGHPHSFLAEMFTDAGIFGILLYGFMITAFVISFIKQRNSKVVLPALISAFIILLHSFFDFETDYLTILSFLFAMFAVIAPERSAEWKKNKAVLVIPVIMTVWSVLNIFAYYNYHMASEIAENEDVSVVYEHTLLSTKLMPIRVDYLTTHGNVCLGRADRSKEYFDEAKEVLHKSHSLNVYNYETLTQLAVLYARSGEYERAGEYVEKLVSLQPFINTTYERVSYIYEVMVNYGTETVNYDSIRYGANMLLDITAKAYALRVEYDTDVEIFRNVKENIQKAKEILKVLDEAGV